MSKDNRDDPYESVRISIAPPMKIMKSKNDYKREDNKKIIEQEIEELSDA